MHVASTVLVVDDSEATRGSIRRILEEAELDLRVLEAADGAEALPLALSGEVDIVVSDIVMPRLDGIQLLRGIRQQRDADSLPVILVTSQVDSDVRSSSFEQGASDYLSKPFTAVELISRIQVQLRLRRLQDELRLASERYRVLGTHDELTGLANRRHFFDTCRKELARSRRHHSAMGVAIIDVDHFRGVNHRVGYLVGDAIITEVGLLITKTLRATDTLARLGGEKFAALLPRTDIHEVRLMAERLLAVACAHAFPGHRIGDLSLSVGAAVYPAGNIETIDELVNAAEASLDLAKGRGGCRAEVWDPTLDSGSEPSAQ